MVKIQNVDPAKLTPADYNPRTISEHQAEALKRSLDRWGFVEPIVANKRTGRIVGGHQRLDGALALALPSVPVHWIDVDESSEKALNIALNKISGDWDEDLLGKLLADLERDGQDLEDLGFDADELQEIIDAAAPEPVLSGDLDDVPEPPADPITQPGDLWQLGEHRLLCGDSTNADDVARLMGEEKAYLLLTDPPYGVDYEGVTNDDAAGLSDLLRSSLALADRFMQPGACYYICHPDVHAFEFISAVREQGWVQARPSTLIWVKDRFVLGRGDYHSQTEPILYGWKPGAAHHALKDRSQSNVWSFDRPAKAEGHPTMKPVGLFARCVSNSSQKKSLIYEPFSGSGTTIIAAEQQQRRCYAMEITPAYCDVAVKRWEQATGRKAERI